MFEGVIFNVKSKEDWKCIFSLFMCEGVKVWDLKIVVKRWIEFVEEEWFGFDFWKINFDFCMLDVVNFQYDDIKSLFFVCLKYFFMEGVVLDFKE